MPRRAVAILIALACASPASALVATSAHAMSRSQPPSGQLHVGKVRLHRCHLGVGRPTWCAQLEVRLDPDSRRSPKIAVGVGWVPARRDVTGPTIVAQEGGPGYPATGTAGDFATMLGPLLDHRNLLVVDARGTGRSTPIDCEPLQSQGVTTASRRFLRAVGTCARQLDHTWRKGRGGRGGYVRAANLFGTAYAVNDLAHIMRALGLGKVDLYGDSYGTYFAQSFLSYHPRVLDAVVLDSAYEAKDLDPWYTTTMTGMRRAFNRICDRSLACSTKGTGTTAWGEIARLARLARKHPVSGWTTGVYGRRRKVTVGVMAVLNMANDAGYDYQPARNLYAAARAYIERRDPALLLRLYAQDVGWDYSDYKADPSYYSDGLFMAVACTDYPQLYSVRASKDARRRQFERAITALPAKTFAPFTTREWVRMLPYTETFNGCLAWPRKRLSTRPVIDASHAFSAADVPVLVLNGDVDTLTPAAGGRHVARQLGPSARSIVVPNKVHLVALYDETGCGTSLVRRFLRAPESLQTLDAQCGRDVPEIHAPGHVQLLTTTRPRSVASTALAAAGDAALRWEYIVGRRDRGLRGGAITYRPLHDGRVAARLHGVRWTSNATVGGRVVFAESATSARAHVTVVTSSGRSRVKLHWRTSGRHARAVIKVNGQTLTLPAP